MGRRTKKKGGNEREKVRDGYGEVVTAGVVSYDIAGGTSADIDDCCVCVGVDVLGGDDEDEDEHDDVGITIFWPRESNYF